MKGNREIGCFFYSNAKGANKNNAACAG